MKIMSSDIIKVVHVTSGRQYNV